jgi:hypothetical protein
MAKKKTTAKPPEEVMVPGRVLKAASLFASKDLDRPILTHILVTDAGPDRIRVVATDSYTAFISEFCGHIAPDTTFLVPAGIYKHIESLRDEVALSSHDKVLEVRINNIIASYGVFGADFPDYKSLILDKVYLPPSPAVGINPRYLDRVSRAFKYMRYSYGDALVMDIHGKKELIKFSSTSEPGSPNWPSFAAYVMPTLLIRGF